MLAIPEVQALGSRYATEGKRLKLQMTGLSNNDLDSKFYYNVRVGDGTNKKLQQEYSFFVYPKEYTIRVFSNGKALTLDEWRKTAKK